MNKHQIDEVRLSRELKKDYTFHHLLDDYDSDIIECPFCFGITVYSFTSPNRCTNCCSEITEADLLNSYKD
jgi:hypothetical protein